MPLVDVSVYVMTPEYGAASQLEKIDMLDFADFVAINKFDRKGGEDAQRDVRKQVQRNRGAFGQTPEQMPVFGTIAARFNDDGVTALYQAVKVRLAAAGLQFTQGTLAPVAVRASTGNVSIVPPSRVRYLAEIAQAVRGYHERARGQVRIARERPAIDGNAAHVARVAAIPARAGIQRAPTLFPLAFQSRSPPASGGRGYRRTPA